MSNYEIHRVKPGQGVELLGLFARSDRARTGHYVSSLATPAGGLASWEAKTELYSRHKYGYVATDPSGTWVGFASMVPRWNRDSTMAGVADLEKLWVDEDRVGADTLAIVEGLMTAVFAAAKEEELEYVQCAVEEDSIRGLQLREQNRFQPSVNPDGTPMTQGHRIVVSRPVVG